LSKVLAHTEQGIAEREIAEQEKVEDKDFISGAALKVWIAALHSWAKKHKFPRSPFVGGVPQPFSEFAFKLYGLCETLFEDAHRKRPDQFPVNLKEEISSEFAMAERIKHIPKKNRGK